MGLHLQDFNGQTSGYDSCGAQVCLPFSFSV